MDEELDEIYEVSDDTSGAWWVSYETYKMLETAMQNVSIKNVVTFYTLSGNEVIIFVSKIGSIGVSTKEQRATSKKHIENWKAESQKNEWEE